MCYVYGVYYVYGVCEMCAMCKVCVCVCVHRRVTATCRCQMDQLVKCLLSKNEELSFTTSTHVKKLNVGAGETAQPL